MSRTINSPYKHTFYFTVLVQSHVIQKAICRVRIVSAIRLKAELTVHEYHCITIFKKVFGRHRSTSTGTKVVNEAYGLVLQRYHSSTTLDLQVSFSCHEQIANKQLGERLASLQ